MRLYKLNLSFIIILILMSSKRLYLFKSNEFEASMYEPTLKVAGAKAAAEERVVISTASFILLV